MDDRTAPPDPTARPSGGATSLPTRSAVGVVVDGRYQIVQPLAAGGMGSVYLGEQNNLKREVAIKLIRQPDPEDAERFRREAEALAEVSHPAIVDVYDYLHEEAADISYLVMAYVKGRNVADHAAEQPGGVLSPLDSVELMLPVASALVELHAHGILHRDLKPANLVRYMRADGRAAVKLVDFGIARREQDAGLTAEGLIVGTPPYLSAEVVLGKRHSEASDVYGFAATLFELMVGEPPHGNDDIHKIFKRIIREKVHLPPALKSTELGSLLLRMLMREPEQRPSMQRVLEELERIRLGLVQQTGDVAAMVEATRAMVPSRELATVEFRSTGPGAGADSGSGPRAGIGAGAGPGSLAPAAARPSPLPWIVAGVAVVVAVVVTLVFTLRKVPSSKGTAKQAAAAAIDDGSSPDMGAAAIMDSAPPANAMDRQMAPPRRVQPEPVMRPGPVGVATAEVPPEAVAREKARCVSSNVAYKMFKKATFQYRIDRRLPWVKAVFVALLECKHTSASQRRWVAYRLSLMHTKAGACAFADKRWKQYLAAARMTGAPPLPRRRCKEKK